MSSKNNPENRSGSQLNIKGNPIYVGEYVINEHLHMPFPKKPNWFHRIMTRVLLGWVWREKND